MDKKKVEIVGGNRKSAPSYSEPYQWDKQVSASSTASQGPKNNSGSSTPKNTTNRRKK